MVYLGSDHGGFNFKEEIKGWLTEKNITYEDMGATSFNPEDDYPDFIIAAAQKVAANPGSLGIILGRSGNGEAIAANKVKEVRAALCLNEEMARKAKQHNNANVLSLGADYISIEDAKKIVKIFIETPFSNEDRHVRRIEKIKKLEESK